MWIQADQIEVLRRAWSRTSATLAMVATLGSAYAAEPTFNHDIRPILSANCLSCHGPDPAARKAKLRLDVREDAMADRDGHAVIVPGQPDAGHIMQRILSKDPDMVMPPPASKKSLTPKQIETLRTWIANGATYEAHWAFTPPQRPAIPDVVNAAWVRNPIDRFVLARLEREGLSPAPEADPLTLLRRASLDIVGLPPTLAEIDAFLAADPAHALDQQLDRLLDSPHFGERWARPWLDAAQFADSDGFEKDKPRQVWAWRDWVINSLNDNMPYNQFVTEQVAGDLLPNATQDQQVATGFLRNSMINEEGGIDPEQFRMEAIFNRMDVIGRAVLGLTVNCAQCHTHKYDPLTHTDYYRLLAFVNNTDEACMAVYTPEEQARRESVRTLLAALDEELRKATPDWAEQLAAWEAQMATVPEPTWSPLSLVFDDSTAGGQKCLPVGDGSYLAQGYAPTRFQPKMAGPSPLAEITAVRLEQLPDPNLPRGGPGRSIYGTSALSEFEFRMAPADKPFDTFDQWEKVEIASAIADVNPPEQPLGPEYPDKDVKRTMTTGPVAMAIDGKQETAWSTDLGPGRSNVARYAIFRLAQPLLVPPGTQLGVRLSQNHGGWNSDDNQNNNLGRFRVSVTDAKELPELALPDSVRGALRCAPEARNAEQKAALFEAWRAASPTLAPYEQRANAIWREHPVGATQLVYHERAKTRITHRLERGDFLKPAEAVEPGVPAFLNPMPEGAPPNRLGLAQWLVDPKAPTTARTFVNRVWQQYFGTGLVATSSDLGLQGEAPSHPELLDWLTVEFVESGWDMKRLHRLIVGSATYRQSSRIDPALLERDPANRLLARGARFRVDGEIVRDIALAASGLLNPKVGGPSIYPPAPEFLFDRPASYGPKNWPVAPRPDRFRRALYTFRFRSVPYPALQAFDTPPGDAPCVMRTRSNTPLQALTTLNEQVFMECANVLASRAIRDGGNDDGNRVQFLFRRCVSRSPTNAETETLLGFLNRQRARITAGTLDPSSILSRPADAPQKGTEELAAWTLAARVMLNLDETITRQ